MAVARRQYAPALSKPAFQNIRPQGNYQSYLKFLGKNRPGWDPARPQVAQTIKPTPAVSGQITYGKLLDYLRPTLETPAQMEARANRMTQQSLAGQQGMLDIEYKKAQDDALRAQLASQSAGRAAAAMNAELMGRVGGAYGGAAGELGQLGGALGAAMAGATASDVAAANQGLAAVGAPGVTVGGPVGAPGIAGEQQAGVETYRGATLPAQQLGTSGLAEQFGMAGMIGSQNLRATQEANAAYLSTMRQAQANKQAAVQTLAQGRPELAAKFLSALQDNQRQAIALASGLIGAGFEQRQTVGKTTREIAQQAEENKQWWAAYNQEATQFSQELKSKAASENIELGTIDAAASKAWGYLVDKAGRPILGKNGKPVPVAKTGKAAGGVGGLTPYQISQLIPKAENLAQTAFYGYGTDAKGKRVPATELATFDPENSATWGKGNLQWPQALQRLRTMGVPAQTARGILSQYYERGDSGRPLFLPEERAVLLKNLGKQRFNWATRHINDLYGRGQDAEADQLINGLLTGRTNLSWITKPRG